MKKFNSCLDIAQLVKEYMAEEGKTYLFSQGKMLRDEEMPADVKELLKSA